MSDDKYRRTGRTFRIIGMAVAALACKEEVIIYAHSVSYAKELRRLVLGGIAGMGGDVSLVEPLISVAAHDDYFHHRRGRNKNVVVLMDHHNAPVWF